MLDILPNEDLYHICEDLDDKSLSRLFQKYRRASIVCKDILQRRKTLELKRRRKMSIADMIVSVNSPITLRGLKSNDIILLNNNIIGFFRDISQQRELVDPQGHPIDIHVLTSTGLSTLIEVIELFRIYTDVKGQKNTVFLSNDPTFVRNLSTGIETSDPGYLIQLVESNSIPLSQISATQLATVINILGTNNIVNEVNEETVRVVMARQDWSLATGDIWSSNAISLVS